MKKKNLIGFSGSKVILYNYKNNFFVRKKKNVSRNLQRYNKIRNLLPLPKIYKIGKNYYDMEYLNGLTIDQYLDNYPADKLISFIIYSLKKISKIKYGLKDYSESYNYLLNSISVKKEFGINQNKLFDKLPKFLPQTEYHGDFTLENIIYSQNKFFMIDCSEGLFDSYVFDYIKLRQDVSCNWFIRKNLNINIISKLNIIHSKLLDEFKYYSNDYLLILMLIRVLRYTTRNSNDYNFIKKKIKILWK